MLQLKPANRVSRAFALILALLASVAVTTPAHAAKQRTNGAIVYVQDGTLGAANPDGTNRRAGLGAGRAPAVAPDGLRMVLVAQSAGNDEIFRAGLDGAGAVNLSRSAGQDTDPSWSAATGRIAFASTARACRTSTTWMRTESACGSSPSVPRLTRSRRGRPTAGRWCSSAAARTSSSTTSGRGRCGN